MLLPEPYSSFFKSETVHSDEPQSQTFNGKNGVSLITIQDNTIKLICETKDYCSKVFKDIQNYNAFSLDNLFDLSVQDLMIQLEIPSQHPDLRNHREEAIDTLFHYFNEEDYQSLRFSTEHTIYPSPPSSPALSDDQQDNVSNSQLQPLSSNR